MTSLFDAAAQAREKPLAAELRPEGLDDIVGQRRLLAPNGIFRRRIAAGRLGSVILFGPPGIGKTTTARAVGKAMHKEFRTLHPAHNNVADIKAVAEEAKMKDILLFVDEVHRFNATQQDYLLSLTENGVFDFISATTGNPYHVLTNALVSRSTVFELEPLTAEDMQHVVRRAIKKVQASGTLLEVGPDAIQMIAARAGGDARRAINIVENVSVGYDPRTPVRVGIDEVEEAYAASPIPYDRNGDAHYDVISAFIKSMRGSDPDATLYWLGRLVQGGEDPRFIARRLIIHASEDVGLADNTALQTAVAALAAVQHIGYPEAQITLAHAALHIARAPKSNSACRGISAAMHYVRTQELIPVPAYLRDAHYAGAAKLGRKGYQFPHDDPRGWVEQDYAPGIQAGQFYESDDRAGPTYEGKADGFWEGVKRMMQPRRFLRE